MITYHESHNQGLIVKKDGVVIGAIHRVEFSGEPTSWQFVSGTVRSFLYLSLEACKEAVES